MKLALATLALVAAAASSVLACDTLQGELLTNPCMDGGGIKPFQAWAPASATVDSTHGSATFNNMPSNAAYDAAIVVQSFMYNGQVDDLLEVRVEDYCESGGTITVGVVSASDLSFAGYWKDFTTSPGGTIVVNESFQVTRTGTLMIRVYQGKVPGHSVVDDVHVRKVDCPPPAVNTTYDFECGSLGPWVPQFSSGSNITVTNTDPIQGSYSVKITVAADGEDWMNQIRLQNIPVIIGKPYRVSALMSSNRFGASMWIEFGAFGNAASQIVHNLQSSPATLAPEDAFVALDPMVDIRFKYPEAGTYWVDFIRPTLDETPVRPTTWGSIKALYR